MYQVFVGMLGTFFGLIILYGFYYWWSLLKMYYRYNKGVDEMSNSKFYIFLALNHLVLILVCLIFMSTFMVGEPVIEVLLLSLITPLPISYIIVRQYKRIRNNNNDTIIKTEDFDLNENSN